MTNKDNLDSILEKANLNSRGSKSEKLKDLVKESREMLCKSEPVAQKDLVEQYKHFRTQIYNPKRVLYPCCDLDISPIIGFPDADVTLIDENKDLEEIMKKRGVPILIADARKYDPVEKNDLIILLNPVVPSHSLVKSLAKGGYVLSNDYHGNASELIKNKDFKFLGTLDKDGRDKKIYLNEGDLSKLGKFVDYFHVFKKNGKTTT